MSQNQANTIKWVERRILTAVTLACAIDDPDKSDPIEDTLTREHAVSGIVHGAAFTITKQLCGPEDG